MKILKYISKNVAGIQGNLFLLIATLEMVFNGPDNNFWMFLFASVGARGLQDIINELRNQNKN